MFGEVTGEKLVGGAGFIFSRYNTWSLTEPFLGVNMQHVALQLCSFKGTVRSTLRLAIQRPDKDPVKNIYKAFTELR